MKVVFIKQCNPGGRRFNPGDIYEFSEPVARLLESRGEVKIEGLPPKEKKDRYNRKDMRASR